MSAQKSKGFTLIELMVTISIIAIISAIGMMTYSQSQKLARDSRRKQDLEQIQKALSLYYSDNNSYPFTPGGGCASGGSTFAGTYCYSNNASSPWILNLSNNYTSSLPKDPLKDMGDPNSGTNYGYGYLSANAATCGADGRYFVLFTRLENTSDPDRLGAKDKALFHSVSSLSNGGAGFGNNMYVITSY